MKSIKNFLSIYFGPKLSWKIPAIFSQSEESLNHLLRELERQSCANEDLGLKVSGNAVRFSIKVIGQSYFPLSNLDQKKLYGRLREKNGETVLEAQLRLGPIYLLITMLWHLIIVAFCLVGVASALITYVQKGKVEVLYGAGFILFFVSICGALDWYRLKKRYSSSDARLSNFFVNKIARELIKGA